MHHTKDKGDVGLGHVIAVLLENGIQVALPISEHLPFDCIAISEDIHETLKTLKGRNEYSLPWPKGEAPDF